MLSKLESKVNKIDTRVGSTISTERIRGWKLIKIRERIGLRDSYTCQRCGRVTLKGQVDHKIPLHLGGQESDENRQWLCPECHEIKSKEEESERKG